jgi:hypothetical protein
MFVTGSKEDVYQSVPLEGIGQIENFHRVLNNGLACEINGRRDDWVKYVDLVLWAYRSQPHSTTGYSPFYVIWERNGRTRR